jgi:hypothetical protein
MDVQEPALAIDVGHLETRTFHEAKTTRVDRGEAYAVDGDPHLVENAPDLVAAQNDGELLLALGAGDLEHCPIAAERLLIEELDPAQSDGVRGASDLLDRAEVEQVLADLLFREAVGGRRRRIEFNTLLHLTARCAVRR